jgi:polysaccharide chain length determinant protein (PEP-CTERM system associated)
MSDLSSQPSFAISDALEILERRKRLLIVSGLFGVALGIALTAWMPPSYTSETTILVEPQSVPDSYVRSTVTLKVQQRLNTLQERVTSYESLNDLINNVGEDKVDLSGSLTREEMMGLIRKNLGVDLLKGTHAATVFELSYDSPDADAAASIVRAIAELFISENIKDRARQAAATSEFLDQELDRLREDVSRQEGAVRAFRTERMGSLPSQLETNLRSLDRLNLELSTNLESQIASSQRAALLRRQTGGVDADGEPLTAAPNSLSRALDDARSRLIQAEGIYTDEHPNVQHLRGEIVRLEKEILEAPPETVERAARMSPVARALQRDIESAMLDLDAKRRRETKIRSEIRALQDRVEETPEREEELRTLTRDYENLTETYRILLSKKHNAAIALNLEQSQKGERFKLLRPARVPTKPSWPDPFLLIPGSMAVTVGLAVAFIVIAEIRYPAFRSVDRLTRMVGLPVFASIPTINNDAIYEEAPSGDVDPKLVVHTAPESSPAEQYRGILPLVLEAEDCRVILVTSAARGDGKTLTCMNLAVSLATDIAKRVLIIDGDLRRPAAHKVIQVSRKRGLSDVLLGNAKMSEVAVNSKIPNLTVIPAGPTARNPLALLTGQRFLQLLEDAKDDYDLIVIDSPPLLPVVDTKILRRMADMVLFVVRADGTPRDAVIRSLDALRGVAGVVFNQVSAGSFRRYYNYDAYSRYAYGDSPDDRDADLDDV